MLYLPQGLPVAATLKKEGADVASFEWEKVLKGTQSFNNATSILFLNLMPQKEKTELDIARMMAGRSSDVVLLPMKIAGQTYKTTPMAHMEQYYRDFDVLKEESFDGLIITGAPVEHLAFEEVRYWDQLCHIMDWAQTHVRSTLYICWGAQAGLYHHYGVPKYALPQKKFGIFPQTVMQPESPLVRNLPSPFMMPNSRHTEVRWADMLSSGLSLVAQSEESGCGIVANADNSRVFIVGHLEYAKETLHEEYLRDKAKGLPIAPAEHYYEKNNAEGEILFSWTDSAKLFYDNWLKICENRKK